MPQRERTYRIVALDGGGIRGILSSVLLQRLESRMPGVLEKVDLFAGTSTGGIIALGLAAGLKPEAFVTLYANHAAVVFDDSFLDDLRDFGRLIGAKYDLKNLGRILEGVFGKKRLKDLNARVVIPSFDLDNEGEKRRPRMWKPKFFHNFPGPDSDGEELVVDIALRTCAAPTFFPTYQGYIDGGVVANNPSMAALAQAVDRQTGRQELSGIRLLSLGTGLNPAYIKGDRRDWGLAQWARPLLALMLEGMMGVADYQCERLLGGRYFRLQPLLLEPIGIDAVDKVSDLMRYASQVRLAKAIRWLEREFR